jgi:RNA polymerase sigma-B factor
VAVGIETSTVGGWRVVAAAGELDSGVGPALRGVLTDLIQLGSDAIVVDLSGVALLSGACVHVLVYAAGRAETSGVLLRVVGARGTVLRVLQISGAAADLGIDPDPDGREPTGRDIAADVVEAILAARAALPEADARRDVLRDRAVQTCLPLAERLAGRYSRPHDRRDELTQVAFVGLLKAVDRFDPARGTRFLGFAFPTILGEIRRYFRDQTWAVHVPRHLQELRLAMIEIAGPMAQQLGREPTTAELADELDEPVENLWESMVAAQGYATTSLSQPVGESGTLVLGDLIGSLDEDLTRVDHHEMLAPLVAALPERERKALAYRFFGNMTQTQIAQMLGVSQMQVSRLLTRALARLRTSLLESETA